jgi:hypothetical protein
LHILNVYGRTSPRLSGVIPEIDIWRVVNLMLKHYGDNAEADSVRRADELAADGECTGVVNRVG